MAADRVGSLCLGREVSRREAARWRRVSVSTVQYWIGRYRTASEPEKVSGAWALDRPSTPHRQPGRVSDDVHDRVCEARERTGWGPRITGSRIGPTRSRSSRAHLARQRLLERADAGRLEDEPRRRNRGGALGAATQGPGRPSSRRRWLSHPVSCFRIVAITKSACSATRRPQPTTAPRSRCAAWRAAASGSRHRYRAP